ncbi:hypothetical protein U3516DRAFT_623216 [Neocallimastix sp. 'constans']
MQYLIFVLGNIVFAALDMALSKSQCKFFGSILILLLHVLAFFFNFSNNILYVSCSLFFNIAKEVV